MVRSDSCVGPHGASGRVTRLCKLMIAAIMLTVTTTLAAQELSARFQHAKLNTERLNYLLTFPKGYAASSKPFPLIVFLHGGSGRGDDLNLIKQYGPELNAEKDPSFPFVVLSSQCPKGEIWTDTEALRDLILDVLSRYRLDSSRVYLTGMSMGGRGTWYMAYRNPDLFSAIAPLAAFQTIPDTWSLTLVRTPVWVFHGDADKLAPISDDVEMVDTINSHGGHAQLSVLKGKGHDITSIYDGPELYRWFLQHQNR